MTIISRDIINKNLTIVESSNLIKYCSIINNIDKAKSTLLKYRIQKHDKIIFCFDSWPEYIIWFFACAELGVTLVIFDYESSNSVSRLELIGSVQCMIFDNALDLDALKSYVSICIEKNSYKQEAPHIASINCDDDTILICSTSSGSEGTPKIINYTHEFLFRLSYRNIDLYKLTSNDRCLHFKGLHHSSIIGVYFLPTIIQCSYHYHETDSKNTWIDAIKNTTRCLLYRNMIDQLSNIQINNKNIYLLSSIDKTSKSIIDLVNNDNIIYSVYGCTESQGPVFLPYISKENYSSYIQENFGKPLDNFYNLKIVNAELVINDNIFTGDCFEIIDDEFYFNGRKSTKDTISLVENMLGLTNQKEFDLVLDSLYNVWYIRLNYDVDVSLLDTLITKKVVAKRDEFMYGIKFDAEKFRNYCRGLE